MKSLSNYTNALQTKLFTATGAFFAFSSKQLNEKKKDGVVYVSMGSGMICPRTEAANLMSGLDGINKTGIAQDIEENGIKAIIHRELANYESQITGDIGDTAAALTDYPITKEQIRSEFGEYYQLCIENDWF